MSGLHCGATFATVLRLYTVQNCTVSKSQRRRLKGAILRIIGTKENKKIRYCQQAAARTQITKDGSIQNEASENSPHHRTLAKLTSLSKKGLGLGLSIDFTDHDVFL
ncbi:hypothetical protein VTP01DRAFT_3009 [Rhizomucor pusillus]|uniref:uncharacterized protein n=1 Tax=Rhizomucor pusillus TaxID=4840 RepID=UPI003743E447